MLVDRQTATVDDAQGTSATLLATTRRPIEVDRRSGGSVLVSRLPHDTSSRQRRKSHENPCVRPRL